MNSDCAYEPLIWKPDGCDIEFEQWVMAGV